MIFMSKGTRKTGDDREKEACEIFESMGFQTWRPIGSGWRLSKDICEAFDIFAWNEEEVYLVQVKSDPSDASKSRKKISSLNIPEYLITQVVLMRRPDQDKVFAQWQLYQSGWQRKDDFTDPIITIKNMEKPTETRRRRL